MNANSFDSFIKKLIKEENSEFSQIEKGDPELDMKFINLLISSFFLEGVIISFLEEVKKGEIDLPALDKHAFKWRFRDEVS